MMHYRIVVMLSLTTIVAGGCSPTDGERCSDMDRVIAARAAALPRACEVNVDCVDVEIHQGLIVAANSSMVDPELDEIKARRIELCGDFEPDTTQYSPACVEGMCVALSSGTVPDAGSPDTEGPVCDCSEDSECTAPDLCVDACLCTPICVAACRNAEACDAIDTLRLGTDYDNCLVRCDADAQSVQGLGRARCLAGATCSDLENCLR